MAGLVSSNPDVATRTHGLTERGREQAGSAVGLLAPSLSWGGGATGLTHVAVYTSDFRRAGRRRRSATSLRADWSTPDGAAVRARVDPYPPHPCAAAARALWWGWQSIRACGALVRRAGWGLDDPAPRVRSGHPAIWAADEVDGRTRTSASSVLSVAAPRRVAEVQSEGLLLLPGSAAGRATLSPPRTQPTPARQRPRDSDGGCARRARRCAADLVHCVRAQRATSPAPPLEHLENAAALAPMGRRPQWTVFLIMAPPSSIHRAPAVQRPARPLRPAWSVASAPVVGSEPRRSARAERRADQCRRRSGRRPGVLRGLAAGVARPSRCGGT